jgi:hypothetical protein
MYELTLYLHIYISHELHQELLPTEHFWGSQIKFRFTKNPFTHLCTYWKYVQMIVRAMALFQVNYTAMYLFQGCQMVYFQTKNPNSGKFCRFLRWKMSVYFMAIWSILRPFGIMYVYLVYFSRFGILYQEKSGNPDLFDDNVLWHASSFVRAVSNFWRQSANSSSTAILESCDAWRSWTRGKNSYDYRGLLLKGTTPSKGISIRVLLWRVTLRSFHVYCIEPWGLYISSVPKNYFLLCVQYYTSSW